MSTHRAAKVYSLTVYAYIATCERMCSCEHMNTLWWWWGKIESRLFHFISLPNNFLCRTSFQGKDTLSLCTQHPHMWRRTSSSSDVEMMFFFESKLKSWLLLLWSDTSFPRILNPTSRIVSTILHCEDFHESANTQCFSYNRIFSLKNLNHEIMWFSGSKLRRLLPKSVFLMDVEVTAKLACLC